MRVWFLPFEKSSNPYQTLLVEALEAEGVEVASDPVHPLLGAARARWRKKLDLIHFHWTSPFLLSDNWGMSAIKSALFIIACCSYKLCGVKLVWTIHNLGDHEARYPQIEIAAIRILCRIYDRIIVHCERAVGIVQQAYALSDSQMDKFAVIPHGHYFESYPNQITRIEARKRLDIRPDDRVFLYFGQMRAYKNIHGLIQAFKALSYQEVRLLLVGKPIDAALENEIRRLSEEDNRIRFSPGFVPAEILQNYFNAADVIVLPYLDNLTSGTVSLAMSFDRPIITPAIGCAPDLLSHQDDLLYDPKDPHGLLEAMRRSYFTDLESFGRINKDSVGAFSWDRIAKLTHEVYEVCFQN